MRRYGSLININPSYEGLLIDFSMFLKTLFSALVQTHSIVPNAQSTLSKYELSSTFNVHTTTKNILLVVRTMFFAYHTMPRKNGL